MVGGLAGPAAVAANQGLRGQQQNTAVQEWTQWKQWALDHKDFEAFRADKSASYDTLKKRLESDEFADEFNSNKAILLARFRETEKQKNTGDKYMPIKIIFGIPLLVILIASIMDYSNQKNNSDPKSSSSLNSTTTALTATAIGKGIRKAPNQT